MESQIWQIVAQIEANILIEKREHHHYHVPHSLIRHLEIQPVIDDKGYHFGIFSLNISFEVCSSENMETDTYLDQVVDNGRDIFHHVVDALTFLTFSPVKIVKQPIFMYYYPGTNNKRILSTSVKFGKSYPPVILSDVTLLTSNIENKYRRIMTWLRKGIEETDVANSIYALYVALEILANQFVYPQKTTRKCDYCGFVSEINPGMRQKIKHFLVEKMGYSMEQFAKIWSIRNDLSHGGFDLSSDNLREMENIRNDLCLSIVKGLKSLFEYSTDCLPHEEMLPWIFHDPLIVIDQTN